MIMSQMTLAKMVGWMGLLMHDAFTIKKADHALHVHHSNILHFSHLGKNNLWRPNVFCHK